MRTWMKGLSAATALLSLSACNMDRLTRFTPEARITAAYPAGQSVVSARDALLANLAEADRKAMTAQFDNKLKLRALNCANGYTPGWLASVEEIRKAVNGDACFAQADADLTRWLSLMRVGQLLGMPPLKPVPAKAPSFIVADESIHDVRFAAQAGVALVMTSRSMQILPLDGGQAVFKENRSREQIGPLSPNGRLFVSGDHDGIRIRETQSGAMLSEWSQASPQNFTWLDTRSAIFVGANSKAMLVDFVSGKEVPLDMVGQGVQRVLPVQGAPTQFVLSGWQKVWKINIDRSKPEPEVTLLAEQPAPDLGCGRGMCGLNADGRYFFNATNKLTLLSPDNLTVSTQSFEPFYIQSAVATADPDQILLTGVVQPSGGEQTGVWFYSLSKQTLSAVDSSKFVSNRFLYIPSLKRVGAISEGKIHVLDELSVTGTKSYDQFMAEALDAANQRKLAAFEREQAMLNGVGMVPALQTYSQRVGSSGGTVPAAGGLVADLARDADVEGVGVYEADRPQGDARQHGQHPMGDIQIRVRRGARPVMLVLTAYEPVRWRVSLEPGARLAGVLVSGYHASEVVGAGNARVIMMGSKYAYDRNSSEFQALGMEVVRMTGKPFRVFQGSYKGAAFSVGG